MRTILISGEGPTDCGAIDHRSSTCEEGPVQIYIRKILKDDELEFITIDKRDVFKVGRSRKEKKSKLEGHAEKAFKMCILAENKGLSKGDVVMCYVDADFDRSLAKDKERAIRRKFDDIYGQLTEGFDHFENETDFDCVPIVPATMIESWILGDHKSFEKCYGKPNKDKVPTFPNEPEFIWGQDSNPSSDYPKNTLTRVLDCFGEEPSRNVFCDIAQASDIETMKSRCGLSFGKLCEDLYKVKP